MANCALSWAARAEGSGAAPEMRRLATVTGTLGLIGYRHPIAAPPPSGLHTAAGILTATGPDRRRPYCRTAQTGPTTRRHPRPPGNQQSHLLAATPGHEYHHRSGHRAATGTAPRSAPQGPGNTPVRCSNYAHYLGWSYGDSNPRPLACHEAPQPFPAAMRPDQPEHQLTRAASSPGELPLALFCPSECPSRRSLRARDGLLLQLIDLTFDSPVLLSCFRAAMPQSHSCRRSGGETAGGLGIWVGPRPRDAMARSTRWGILRPPRTQSAGGGST